MWCEDRTLDWGSQHCRAAFGIKRGWTEPLRLRVADEGVTNAAGSVGRKSRQTSPIIRSLNAFPNCARPYACRPAVAKFQPLASFHVCTFVPKHDGRTPSGTILYLQEAPRTLPFPAASVNPSFSPRSGSVQRIFGQRLHLLAYTEGIEPQIALFRLFSVSAWPGSLPLTVLDHVRSMLTYHRCSVGVLPVFSLLSVDISWLFG